MVDCAGFLYNCYNDGLYRWTEASSNILLLSLLHNDLLEKKIEHK